MSFPPGKPILAIALLALLSGGAEMLQRSGARADYSVWVFDPHHADILRGGLSEQYQQETGHSIDVRLINARALDVRLLSLFGSGAQTHDVPDLVEVEIGSVGKYFRGKPAEIGFVPLNRYLERSGWLTQLVMARLQPWSKNGVVFGIPHDVHSVGITYRKDLFDQAGIDLSRARTWGEFQERCLAFEAYWGGRGYGRRAALELPRATSDRLVLMLQQRHVNLIDQNMGVHLDDPRVAQTLAFYAQCVAGPRRMATPTAPGPAWVAELERGEVCAALTPDWRLDDLRDSVELRGKLALMALPVFDGEDAPTASWGGTMIGIPKACAHPDGAWKLLEYLYLSPQGLAARRRASDILPAIPSAWRDPTYHQPAAAGSAFAAVRIDGLWVPQEMLIWLAPQAPPVCATPYTTMAAGALSVALNRAVDYVDAHGAGGLQKACTGWLAQGAEDLRRRIAFAQDP